MEICSIRLLPADRCLLGTPTAFYGEELVNFCLLENGIRLIRFHLHSIDGSFALFGSTLLDSLRAYVRLGFLVIVI
jgi:hypothetical protein